MLANENFRCRLGYAKQRRHKKHIVQSELLINTLVNTEENTNNRMYRLHFILHIDEERI